MISSAGFFASIPCPYLKSGLCERPYCHFNHDGKESTGNSSTYESLATQDLDFLLDKLKKSCTNISDSRPSTSSSTGTSYVPTPLHKLKQRKSNESTSSVESSSSSSRHRKVPTYVPTPISELKRVKAEKDSVKSKKRKGSQDSTSSTYSISSQEGESKNGDEKKPRLSTDESPQCKFKNGSSAANEKLKLSPTKSESKEGDSLPLVKLGKERIAHSSSSTIKRPQSKPARQDVRDVMMKRYLESTETSSKGSQDKTTASPASTSSSSAASGVSICFKFIMMN